MIPDRHWPMAIRLVEKMAISAPVGGKIRSQRANEAAGCPDSKTCFNFSVSQKLAKPLGFDGLYSTLYIMYIISTSTKFCG